MHVETRDKGGTPKVLEFAKYIGGVERPIVATPRGGSSFDIGRLTDEDKESVPLNEVRPLFARAMLLDDDEGADVLALSDSVNDVLRDPAGGGRKAALVFVDVSRFPGAFKIAGKYVTKDGATAARFKLRRGRVALTDWIEVSGEAGALPARIVEAARKHLP